MKTRYVYSLSPSMGCSGYKPISKMIPGSCYQSEQSASTQVMPLPYLKMQNYQDFM